MSSDAFSFQCGVMGGDAIQVLSFVGEESLDAGYVFDLALLATQDDLEENLLKEKLTFTIHRPNKKGGDAVWHGVAQEVEYRGSVHKRHIYQVRLVPTSWRLRQEVDCALFFDKKLPALLEDLLKAEKLTAGTHFRMACTSTAYPGEAFVCRYNESAFAFMSRHMERCGIYSFIEQKGNGDVLVLADAKTAHSPLPQGKDITYAQPSGLSPQDASQSTETIHAFSRAVRRTTKSTELRDYNTEASQPNLSAKADVTDPRTFTSEGRSVLFGEGFQSAEKGRLFANVLQESHICDAQTFYGASSVPHLRPGYLFTLKNPPRAAWEGDYLLLSVRHKGSQADSVASSLGLQGFPVLSRRRGQGFEDADEQREGAKRHDEYSNSFTCIPASIQYRAGRKTPWPRIDGVLNGVIDFAQSGERAITDKEGRYTVTLPFGTGDRNAGNHSIPLRMMQPHAGTSSGIHFPLQQGVEVLVAFIGGDPDRPVIAGALPNPTHPSPVKDEDQTKSVIKTPGGHTLVIEESATTTVTLSSPDGANFIRIQQ